MHYVILRDDDTNALTPVSCLERLYRPFLDRGLPVNLAVIPQVCTDLKMANGQREGFLMAKKGNLPLTLPITCNGQLLDYLRANPGYRVVQHGCYHEYFEFDRTDRSDLRHRLLTGAGIFREAGLPVPQAFVAPHDKFSPVSFKEVARRFRVISSGWYEWRRLPPAWWPQYLLKKLTGASHWRAGRTILLSHPGCLLSCYRDYAPMLGIIKDTLRHNSLTVLVTHWWEYFRKKEPDEAFIRILHELAAFLEKASDLKVISFEAIANGAVRLGRHGWSEASFAQWENVSGKPAQAAR